MNIFCAAIRFPIQEIYLKTQLGVPLKRIAHRDR